MNEIVPKNVVTGVAEGLVYEFSREGWHAVPAKPATPKLTPINALRRLDRYFAALPVDPGTYVTEALSVLWDHVAEERKL
jgi:hypothetical protein